MNILPINKTPYVRSYPYHAFVDMICNNDMTNSEEIAEFDILNDNIKLWNVYTNKTTHKIEESKISVFSNPYVESNNFKIYRKLKRNDELIVRINKHMFANTWSNISLFIADNKQLPAFPDFVHNNPGVVFTRGIGYGFYMHINNSFKSILKTKNIFFPYYIKMKLSSDIICFYVKDEGEWKKLSEIEFEYGNNFCLGIGLNISDNQYINWLYTNFINLQGKLEDSVVVDWINNPKRNYKFYSINPMLMFEYNEINVCNSYELLNFILKNINNKKYMEVYLNEKYIKNTSCYQKYDYIHENLCYGCDEDSGIIYLVNMKNGRPNLIETSINEFLEGFLNNDNNNFVYTLQYNPDMAYYKFNIKYMILNLKLYLKGNNISESFGFCSVVENKMYGIEIYDILISDAGISIIIKDKRISFILNEHKKIMRDRVQFLYDRKFISKNKYLKLYPKFQENYEISKLILMLVLKNQFKKINKIENKLLSLLKKLKKNELIYINKLIKSIHE